MFPDTGAHWFLRPTQIPAAQDSHSLHGSADDSRTLSSGQTNTVFKEKWMIASATPAASGQGKNTSALEERGIRGLKCHRSDRYDDRGRELYKNSPLLWAPAFCLSFEGGKVILQAILVAKCLKLRPRPTARPLSAIQDDSLRPRMRCSYSIDMLLPRTYV